MIRQKIETRHGDLLLGVCSSLSDFASVVAETPLGDYYDGDRSLCGCNRDEAVQFLRQGDPALVGPSDRLLDRLESVNPPARSFETQRAMVGGVPSVPDYLSGNPMNTRLRRRVEAQGSPIAVAINLIVSGGVDAATINRRGAAALALVRNLAARRPVTLFLMGGQRHEGRNVCPVVPLDTAPLDLARAAWALSAVGMARQAMFRAGAELAGKCSESIRWPFGHDYGTKPGGICVDVMRALGFDQIVEIPGVFLETVFATDKAAADWVAETAASVAMD